MNFIFISPHFPYTYYEFCIRLKQNGVNVLGIADAPYESLRPELKEALTEYYRVESMEDYEQMYKAVAYFAFKYGRIDWIESNNEYWLEQDARLRTDFNVASGIKTDRIRQIKEKSEKKKVFVENGIPSARQILASEGEKEALLFAQKTGYPLIAKPNVGVGANGTYKLHDDNELSDFFDKVPNAALYVIEEFIKGNIFSYDAVIDANGDPIFESMAAWPPSIMDIVNKQKELSYYVAKEMYESVRLLGRRIVKAFGVVNRFVHLELFRLDSERKGLGKAGDFVALEVNMRPAGAFTPDMMNYSHSTDVYKIWADMVAFGERRTGEGKQYYCAYAGRRDIYDYLHSHDEVLERYRDSLVMCERMTELFWPAMGQQMYTVRLNSRQEVEEFVNFVLAKK